VVVDEDVGTADEPGELVACDGTLRAAATEGAGLERPGVP
jgi:hypothetical protein